MHGYLLVLTYGSGRIGSGSGSEKDSPDCVRESIAETRTEADITRHSPRGAANFVWGEVSMKQSGYRLHTRNTPPPVHEYMIFQLSEYSNATNYIDYLSDLTIVELTHVNLP